MLDHLLPGKRLYLLGTGTGLAPFMSIIRDPETYERFEHVVVAHGVRHVSELGYRDYIENELPSTSSSASDVKQQLRYYPTVTREPFRNQGRITDLLDSGKLPRRPRPAGARPRARPRDDLRQPQRCWRTLVALLEARGFEEGSSDAPGHYVDRARVRSRSSRRARSRRRGSRANWPAGYPRGVNGLMAAGARGDWWRLWAAASLAISAQRRPGATRARWTARSTAAAAPCAGGTSSGPPVDAGGVSGTTGTGGSSFPEPTTGVAELAAGHYHTCARMADATVRCWGYNYGGMIGDGSTGTCSSRRSR